MNSFDFDPPAVQSAVNASGAFPLAARYWSALLALDLGGERYQLKIRDGRGDQLCPRPDILR